MAIELKTILLEDIFDTWRIEYNKAKNYLVPLSKGVEFLESTNSLVFKTGSSEDVRMTITNSGDVLVGTTSSGKGKLFINRTGENFDPSTGTNSLIQLKGGNPQNVAHLGINSSGLNFNMAASGDFIFGSAGDERVRITNEGNIEVNGIGTFKTSGGDVINLKPNEGQGHVIRYGGSGDGANALRFLGVSDEERMRLRVTGSFNGTNRGELSLQGFISSDHKNTSQGFVNQHKTEANLYCRYSQTGSEYQAMVKGFVDHGANRTNSVLSIGTLNDTNNTTTSLGVQYIDANGNGSRYNQLIDKSGNASFEGNVSVATPTSSTHAATKKYVDDAIASVLATRGNSLYPVGSIYINANTSTNPATLLGFGTWVRYGNGRALVGVDGNQTEFNSLGKTGGFKTHTLSLEEMPPHTHAINDLGGNGQDERQSKPSASDGLNTGRNYTTGRTGGNSFGVTKAHNNLQPYITVYIWRRTA